MNQYLNKIEHLKRDNDESGSDEEARMVDILMGKTKKNRSARSKERDSKKKSSRNEIG